MVVDTNSSNIDRNNARSLLNLILEDEFLYMLHMHHDLHESVLGKLVYLLNTSMARFLMSVYIFF